MKIAIIGSTQYSRKMTQYAESIQNNATEIRLPVFDHDKSTELEIFNANCENIKWADRVDIFWDQRSMGTIFDFGMAFALHKPIHIEYMEPQTFANGMGAYEKSLTIDEIAENGYVPTKEVMPD